MTADARSPDDLGVLDPVARRVDLSNGTSLDVLQITVRKLPAFVRALGPARDDLADPGADLWALIANHGENITDALVVALAIPKSLVEGMSPGDYLNCINAVLEVNRDFFQSWLLAPAMAMAARKAPEDGQTCSSPLSAPDTIQAA